MKGPSKKIKIPRKRLLRGDNASFIHKFLKEGQNNVELRFYKSRINTLLQVFKGYDVRHWGLDFFVPKGNHSIVLIIFKKEDPKSIINFTRFVKCEYFEKFTKLDYYGDIAYFACFKNKVKLNKVIRDLIIGIYKIDYDEVSVVFSKC